MKLRLSIVYFLKYTPLFFSMFYSLSMHCAMDGLEKSFPLFRPPIPPHVFLDQLLVNTTQNQDGSQNFTNSSLSSTKAGLLDPSFGDNGTTIISSDATIHLGDLTFDAQNRMLVALGVDVAPVPPAHPTTKFTVVRLRDDGSFDPTFGSGGYTSLNYTNQGIATAILSLQNGSIIVAGYYSPQPIFISPYQLILVRFLYDGSLDTSFGNNGVVLIKTKSESEMIPYAMTMDRDFNIIIVGKLRYYNNGIPVDDNTYAFITKTDQAGVVDLKFGTKGIVIDAYANTLNWFTGVVTDNYDRIVSCGISTSLGDNDVQSLLVTRYSTEGARDTTFGTGGIVKTNINIGVPGFYIPGAYALQIDSIQRIVVGGVQGTQVPFVGALYNFIGARYFPSGRIDTSFGVGGIVKATFDTTENYGLGVQIDVRSNIYLMGVSVISPGNTDVSVVRYRTSGVIDTTFGAANTGKVSSPVKLASNEFASGLDWNGRVVMGGSVMPTFEYPYYSLVLKRYTSDYGLLFTS